MLNSANDGSNYLQIVLDYLELSFMAQLAQWNQISTP
jgi:hypothetical protein